jgi:hypothetical protein
MIDLSRSRTRGPIDADLDGLDDRVLWQTPYPLGANGVRVDADRGLVYVAGPDGLDIWAVCEDCCDLGVDLPAKTSARPGGDRDTLLGREKAALQQEIAAGLDAIGRACGVAAGSLSMIEQGSGACIWRPNPAAACGSNYQPGLSDHDFEVFVPAGISGDAQACVTDTLNGRFRDPATDTPRRITLPDGSVVQFDDITFFPVSRERFESARLDVLPPVSGGSDPTGDLGLGRQQLLLKWLLEGEYVDVPGYSLAGRDLEEILATLTATTGIPVLEGYEWANLQAFNLAKSKARLRVAGSSDPGSAFHKLFVKQVHDAGKAGIRTTLARMVADPEANRLVLATTRAGYRQNGCFDIRPELTDPNAWPVKPCGSFEEYVASAAARTLRGPRPLPVFTRARVVDEVRRFYRVKADEEVLVTDGEANRFIAGRPPGPGRPGRRAPAPDREPGLAYQPRRASPAPPARPRGVGCGSDRPGGCVRWRRPTRARGPRGRRLAARRRPARRPPAGGHRHPAPVRSSAPGSGAGRDGDGRTPRRRSARPSLSPLKTRGALNRARTGSAHARFYPVRVRGPGGRRLSPRCGRPTGGTSAPSPSVVCRDRVSGAPVAPSTLPGRRPGDDGS